MEKEFLFNPGSYMPGRMADILPKRFKWLFNATVAMGKPVFDNK